MRTVIATIDEITAALPSPPPSEVFDNILTLKAELGILRRTGEYHAPESVDDLWQRLSTTLYRYMPDAKSYPWAQAISDIITAG